MVGQQPPTMPGTVRRTPTGWLADVSVNGVRKTGLCKTKAEALARKRELLEALVSLEATPTGLSLFSLKDARQLSLQVRWAGTAGERTAAIYSQAVLDHFGAHTLLSEITAAGVDAWRRKLLSTGNRPATINKKVSALKAMLADYAAYEARVGVAPLPPGYSTQKQLAANAMARQMPLLASAAAVLALLLGGGGFLAWRWSRRRGGRA